MSREKLIILSQTIRQLNSQYVRRVASATSGNVSGSNTASDFLINPPLASNKVIHFYIFKLFQFLNYFRSK